MALVSPGTVNITVGQRQPSVSALQIGSQRLENLVDVDMSLATEDSVIVYEMSTKTFKVEPFSAFNLTLDNGYF
jgi:hypothetical protein